jgi:hypothetical protein
MRGWFRISAVFLVLVCCVYLQAQFLPDDLEKREQWEAFLVEAEAVEQEQMKSREAVTSPWILTLDKDGIQRKALWKNPVGRMQGYWENWKWEIAAYHLDKHLGLNMVPPTVERRFAGDLGSCQLWVDDCMTIREKNEKEIKTPPHKVFYWNRALYLQRAFDNLIANEDRHQNQYLITADFRMMLIDHSRSFRTSGKFTKDLIYSKKSKEEMKQLPAAFVEKLRTLDFETVKSVVGEYLTGPEIEAVLKRAALILKEIDQTIAEVGKEKVLY